MSKGITKKHAITLEELAREKLNLKLVQQIDEAEIEIWDKIEPGVRLKITNKYCEFRVKVPTKKLAKYLVLVSSSILILVKVINWLIPLVENYYK